MHPNARRQPGAGGGRKAAQSEATRAQLVGVATRLFAERGYAGVGTEEIVREAGVTRGALYHHFADKRELFRAVHEGVEAAVVRGIVAGVAGIDDPWDLMIAGVRAYLDACTEPTVMQITLVDAPSVLGWKEWREIDARHGLGLVAAGLRAAMDAGVLRRRPVEPLAHLLLAAMAEAGLMVATAPDTGAARDAVEGPLLALLEGLRSPGVR
jgi:AcrR family transcriptional regulator